MKRVLLATLMLTSVSAFGGDAQPGTLSTVHFMSSGVVMVYTSGSRSNVPACAASFPSRFVVDGSTAGGKVQVSGLLTAYAAGKSVRIIGTGTCSVAGNSETIDFFYTAD
jgi:hypothetical protein